MSWARRKIRVGRVASDKMDKTVVVAVVWHRRHPLYKKAIKRVVKLKAHDETNQCHQGDLVRIRETRPVSRDKRWRVVEILERREALEIKPKELDQELIGQRKAPKPAVTTADRAPTETERELETAEAIEKETPQVTTTEEETAQQEEATKASAPDMEAEAVGEAVEEETPVAPPQEVEKRETKAPRTRRVSRRSAPARTPKSTSRKQQDKAVGEAETPEASQEKTEPKEPPE